MKTHHAIVLIACLGLPCAAAEPESRLTFPGNGFSIAPLEGVSDTTSYQVVAMFLLPTEAFAPNVNVQIQPYAGTLKEYAELSRQQFKTAGLTMLGDKATDAGQFFEYSGQLTGRKLHWYSRAVSGEGRVYLVTATATETQWKTDGDKLKACVDSFKLDEGGKPPAGDK